jgi:hypothetical protein
VVQAGSVARGVAKIARRVVPLPHHLAVLGGGEERQLGEPPPGALEGAGEQSVQVRQQALHGGGIEEVGVVVEPAAQLLAAVDQPELEIELRRARRELPGVQRDPGQIQRGGRHVEQLEADLEERGAPQVAVGPQLLDQFLEGEALVGIGAERDLAHPLQQLPEARIAGEIGAQDQHVDEEADQRLHLAAIAVGDGGADGNIALPRVALEQRLEGGEESHEQGGAPATAELPQPLRQVGRNDHEALAAGRLREDRPGPVGGPVERGDPRQPLAPVGELPLQDLAPQPPPLPGGEVGVLDGQRRQRRRRACGPGAVQGRQLAHEDPRRPAVENDVVEREERRVLRLPQTHQQSAHQRPARQVEGAQRLPERQLAGLRVPHGRGEPPQVGQRDLEGGRGLDGLHRLAVHLREGGAEALVTPQHLVQAPPQRGHVQAACHAKGGRLVVGQRPGFEPVEEPEPLLGEGERQQTVPRHRDDRRHVLPAVREAQLFHLRRHGGHGRRLEEDAQGQLHAERLPHP